MDRRVFIKYAGLGVCSSLICSSGFALPATDNKPNILFIMTDQQHAGMISCTGNRNLLTPALDKLAASGIRFERAYSTNPVCVPSRFSLQTGLMPSAVGGYDNDSVMGAQVSAEIAANSLGPLFHRAGYDCAYSGKVHVPASLWGDAGTKKSWNYFSSARAELVDKFDDYLKKPHDKPFLFFASFINPHDICYLAYPHKYMREDLLAGKSDVFNTALRENGLQRLKTMQELDHFIETQCPKLPDNFEIPYREPEAITTKYLEDREGFRMFVRENWDEGMWRIHRWLYARLTERVDRHLGRILDVLQQSQYANNTLVVFTSDHGDLNSAHRMEHKCVPYDESVRVPFIMSFPGKIPAGVVDEEHFISNGLDLLPTLCDYAGIDAPEYLPGRSLRPLAENKDVEWRDCIFAESQNARLVCNDKFTYMIFDSGKDCEFLIDRKNDPGEMHNIAYDEKYKEQLNHMRQLLQDWVKKIDDNIGKKYILAPQS